jgi:LysR family hydrogen peroxide-inducible transcriptional activator
MEITLRQLKYLIALAEEGHFGRAAARAHVSQPALSVQIRALEAALGVQLVERGAREAVVTPVGREMVRRARRIMAELGEMTQAARWQRGLDGRLRLGVIPTVAPYLLPAVLPLLRGRNIALDLGIREAQTHALVEELQRGELDAAVIAVPAGGRDLVAVPLFEDRFLLAGSARQIAAMRAARVRPDQMEPDRLLLLEDGHCLTDQALAVCGIGREETRVDLRASSLATLCRLVEAGFGLTFVPELALRAETAAAPRMALMRFDRPEPRRTIGLMRRRTSTDDGWFGDLAGVLREAAGAEIGHAAAAVPPCAAEKPQDKAARLG